MKPNSFSRRHFLKTGVAASALGFPTIIPSHVLGGPDAPSNKLNIAGIGVGNQGRGNMIGCKGENVVALCDVDHKFAADAFEDHPGAKRYKDYKVMFAEMKDIDAVVIATPDHTHASIAMAAMKKGMHVFCQKPLTHDISEARILAAAAKKYDVVTQMGIQGHAQEGLRVITEMINEGIIGEVQEVDAWCSLMYSPPGHAYWSSILQDRPKEGQPLPDGLDWENWIGPAAMREYHRCYHPSSWRCWWDFGCGMMGDRGAHTLDPVFSALKLGYPDSIEGSGIVGGNSEVHPDKAKVVFKFPEHEGFPALNINWYEGQEPPRPKEFKEKQGFMSGGGSLIKGEKGMIMSGVYGNHPTVILKNGEKVRMRTKKTIPRIKGGIIPDWIRAIKEGRKACADFSYSGPLTELALLGNLAKRFPGQELKWDGKAMKVSNHAEANDWVKRPRRKGWEI